VKYLSKPRINKILAAKKRIFLFLDYDGTLTPIVQDPHAAHLDEATKKLLKKLSLNKNIVVSIISGRMLADIKKRVGLDDLFYSGNHGLEIYYKGCNILVKGLKYNYYAKLLALAKKELKKKLHCIKGVVFEDKKIILAVHYRKIQPKQAVWVKKAFKEATAPFLKDGKLKVTTGKRVLELRPSISCSKADAVDFFQKRLKKSKNDITIFIGDDLTDEDVFKKLKNPDIGVRVGPKASSRAKYFLKNAAEVKKFLRYLFESQRLKRRRENP